MIKSLKIFIGVLTFTVSAVAFAQPAIVQPAAPKPKVYALISAVGDQFTIVTLKQSVGSNILDNYRRDVMKVPNNGLNASILKGLDRAIEQRDPGSTRILATLNALEMEGVLPIDREKVAMKKLLAAFEKMPRRIDMCAGVGTDVNRRHVGTVPICNPFDRLEAERCIARVGGQSRIDWDADVDELHEGRRRSL